MGNLWWREGGGRGLIFFQLFHRHRYSDFIPVSPIDKWRGYLIAASPQKCRVGPSCFIPTDVASLHKHQPLLPPRQAFLHTLVLSWKWSQWRPGRGELRRMKGKQCTTIQGGVRAVGLAKIKLAPREFQHYTLRQKKLERVLLARVIIHQHSYHSSA